MHFWPWVRPEPETLVGLAVPVPPVTIWARRTRAARRADSRNQGRTGTRAQRRARGARTWGHGWTWGTGWLWFRGEGAEAVRRPVEIAPYRGLFPVPGPLPLAPSI